MLFIGSSGWTRTTSVCNINSISPSLGGSFHCVAAHPSAFHLSAAGGGRCSVPCVRKRLAGSLVTIIYNKQKGTLSCVPYMAPPVGLEPRPFATSIQFRRRLAAHFIVLRHTPPRSIYPPPAAVAARFPASASGSQARWLPLFIINKKVHSVVYLIWLLQLDSNQRPCG